MTMNTTRHHVKIKHIGRVCARDSKKNVQTDEKMSRRNLVNRFQGIKNLT